MTKPDDRLMFLLFTAQQKLRNYLNQSLQEDNVRITVPQAGILFLLKGRENRTMSEIGQLLNLDNSTVTGLADRLEKAGYVTREPNPGDRRAWHLHLTAQGRGEAQKASRVVGRVNAEVKAGISEQDMDAFKRVLNGFSKKFRK